MTEKQRNICSLLPSCSGSNTEIMGKYLVNIDTDMSVSRDMGHFLR